MSEETSKVLETPGNKSESVALMSSDRDKKMNSDRDKKMNSEMVDVDLEKRVQSSTTNGLVDEKSDKVKFSNGGEEGRDLSPVEDRVTKESVVTIDTTDKRSHRSGTRAQHTYAAKKTVAQGMMDVALITANANQLRYLIEYQRNSPTFFLTVFLIVFSLLLQIGVGVSLIFKGRFDIQGMGKSPQARKINNYVVVGVFLITIINVFVAAFSISAAPVNSLPPATVQQT